MTETSEAETPAEPQQMAINIGALGAVFKRRSDGAETQELLQAVEIDRLRAELDRQGDELVKLKELLARQAEAIKRLRAKPGQAGDQTDDV